MEKNQLAPLIAAAADAASTASRSGSQSSEFFGHLIGLVPLALSLFPLTAPFALPATALAQLGMGIYTAHRSHLKVSALNMAAAVANAAAGQLPKG